MAVGNRRTRRRLMLLALGGLGSYFVYSTGRVDPFFNAHRCAAREFYSLGQGSCAPCTACDTGEEVISPCHGTSNTICRPCRPGVEYLHAGVCVPCSACPISESTLRVCEGTSDTICSQNAGEQPKMDVSGFHDTSATQIKAELAGGAVLPPASLPPPDHVVAIGASGAPTAVTPHSAETKSSTDVASEAAKRFASPPVEQPAATVSTSLPPPPPPPRPPLASEAADTSWKPVWGRTTTGPLVPNTKDWIEDGWGADCYSDKNMDVLVALPYSPKMGEELVNLMFSNLKAMECDNHGFNLHLALYDRPFNNSMNAKATKLSGRTVLATIRNIVIHEYLRPEHEYVIWLDADVVKYPSDLILRLYETNPHGVSAPLVLIESSDAEWYHKQMCGRTVCPHGTICGRPHCPRAKMFYDRAAFITAGANITDHEAFPGNALPWPPYLGRGAWRTRVQDCESVGTVYMLPAEVYRQQPGKPAPPIHFPTAFTEHYPVVHFAKWILNMPVVTDMAIEAEHAYLPKYGQEWHSEPMEIWERWLEPYRGMSLTDPKLIVTQKPDFYIAEEPKLRAKGMFWETLA